MKCLHKFVDAFSGTENKGNKILCVRMDRTVRAEGIGCRCIGVRLCATTKTHDKHTNFHVSSERVGTNGSSIVFHRAHNRPTSHHCTVYSVHTLRMLEKVCKFAIRNPVSSVMYPKSISIPLMTALVSIKP